MKLLQVDTLETAREKLLRACSGQKLQTERLPLEQAFGRILAEDIRAGEAIPSFRRSSVDGYAVRSADTTGATESIPVFLEIVEDVAAGQEAISEICPGMCAYVPTGGMIPEGADAMVMVEYTELFDENHVAVYASAAFGQSVVQQGEDVTEGRLLLPRGKAIGPAQAGALAAAGIREVTVYIPWRVSIISTGDELVSVDEKPRPGQVRDINTWSLSAYAAQMGMQVMRTCVLRDEEDLLLAAVQESEKDSDLVLVSGGSSQGKKDATNDVLDRVSDGGVFTHGLALKPGKPTILGFDRKSETLLAGLPGHPTAALTVFQLLLVWLWRELTGEGHPAAVTASMKSNLASAPGKTTCVLVRLKEEDGGYTAEPILGKSGLITTMAEADGYILIDMNREGLKKGEMVRVFCFQ